MGLRLQGEVSLDGSGFEAGIKKLESAAGRFAGGLKSVAAGAFGIYGVEQAIAKTVDRMEELANAAERLGVGVEFFQELAFGARQTGASVEHLTKFLETLNANREGKDSAWARLGVSGEARSGAS